MQLSNNQIIQNFRHGKYVYKNRINRGTEMCQEFWHVSVSLVLAIRAKQIAFFSKIM